MLDIHAAGDVPARRAVPRTQGFEIDVEEHVSREDEAVFPLAEKVRRPKDPSARAERLLFH